MPAVLAVDELLDGVVKLARADHARIVLARVDGEVRAVQATCTHARIFLAPGRLTADKLIECPMHGAMFSPLDGSVRCGPATVPLAVHEVRVVDGMIHVDPGEPPAEKAAAGAAAATSTKPGARPSAAQWGNWG